MTTITKQAAIEADELVSRKAAIAAVQDNLAFSVKAQIIAALNALPAVDEWKPIETASKSEMILGHADGMVRLVMWESDRWVQVGVTIEAGWFEPIEWKPIGALPVPPQ